jgi:hypothetical protein
MGAKAGKPKKRATNGCKATSTWRKGKANPLLGTAEAESQPCYSWWLCARNSSFWGKW